MKEREKNDISNHEDSVLRVENDGFFIPGLNEKLNRFFYEYSDHFFSYIKQALNIKFDKNKKSYYFYEEWCNQGIKASFIKPGGEWQKGKVRFRIKAEFFPDEVEEEKVEENGHQEAENINNSPLDEIRQQLTEENPS